MLLNIIMYCYIYDGLYVIGAFYTVLYSIGHNILSVCAGSEISITCTHLYNALNGCHGEYIVN